MKHGFLKVAAATPLITVNGISANCKNIINQIKEASENGAKVVVFPELCLTGYTCGDLFLQSTTPDRAKKGLAEILNETKSVDILFAIGMPLKHEDKLYNVAAVCKGGKVLGFVPKSYLTNYAPYTEIRYFNTIQKTVEVEFYGNTVPMGTKLIFCAKDMEALRISCEICEDMWVASPPSAEHAQNGAIMILNLSANEETPGKSEARKLMAASNSARQLSAYIYADAGDGESTTDCVYSGNNMIFECGKCLAEAKPFENGIIYGVIDTQKLSQLRCRRNTFLAKNDEEYKRIYFDTEVIETPLEGILPSPFVPKDTEKLSKKCSSVFTMQAKGLEKRIKHIGIKTVTIGVSGGLDSTLAVLVAAKAFDNLGLDRKGIISVSMPCFGTSERTYNNSKRLADALGVTYREVNITEAVKQHFADIELEDGDRSVTYENAQARERTQVLMDIANKTGGIVIGTGDLSELALGFATYNGDQMSMYGVNASVPKTLMRSIVRWIADTWSGELSGVLFDIVDTPVSPELLPADEKGAISQKTEDIIGPYEVHDFAIYYTVKYGFGKEKILRMAKAAFGGKYEDGQLENWIKTFEKRFYQNQFKRSATPDGVKAESISLSPRNGWNMPSDAVIE
ncbi:MAG: NAD(+) synthase [Clostridia bacterium]|nr:NAD(+) synthase [Clostridia bacterium]